MNKIDQLIIDLQAQKQICSQSEFNYSLKNPIIDKK